MSWDDIKDPAKRRLVRQLYLELLFDWWAICDKEKEAEATK